MDIPTIEKIESLERSQSLSSIARLLVGERAISLIYSIGKIESPWAEE